MSDTNNMITLVIHTPERAGILKNILENHGLKVVLEDFIVSRSTLRVAERVKIYPDDLPLALKILESGDNYSAASIAMKMAGMSGNLLIPVDFSDSSLISVKMGFDLARRLSVHPVVMHSFVAPLFSPSGSSLGDPGMDPSQSMENVIEEEMATKDLRAASAKRMSAFRDKIIRLQEEGEISKVKFSTNILEGVAEEVILNYCAQTPPMLVVMATRGVDKKEEDLIGSVTAEVLDSCRVPVLTVPDNHNYIPVKEIKRLMIFCNIDQHDVLAVDALMRMFDFPECEVILVPTAEKRKFVSVNKLNDLCSYFNETFPSASFSVSVPNNKNYREEIDTLINKNDIQLLVVPNKKTNIFSRIFHPTIAHRFLFERDMMMLALPV
ncbi:MAG: universal stress protein [Muribaculaceae bacterium]|nr:universal stress protein [Muribaculaceae bacterium]